jgi:N-glycosylase/DNA lyase
VGGKYTTNRHSEEQESSIEDLQKIYTNVQKDIVSRLLEFKQLWEQGTEFDVYSELVFCLTTPQSKARSCWATVQRLQEKELILNGTESQLANELNCVRFKNTKAKNILRAQKMFVNNGKVKIKDTLMRLNNSIETREWLVENIKGMGYKEASHFLRNIGFGDELAILDRHILRNLKTFGLLNEIPGSISKKRYLEIENKMMKFASKIQIPLHHLDLLLWYKETGEIFK